MIGYACLALGVPGSGLKTTSLKHASRERLNLLIGQNLAALEALIDCNIKSGIKLFRISSDLIPFGSSAAMDLPWRERFAPVLERIGGKVRASGMRVSMHPGQYTVLNALDPEVAKSAVLDLDYHCQVLDAMDRYNLWDDTLLIVNTDHGFLLGERDWWAKVAQPFWNEVAQTPLFIWDPRSAVSGERRNALVQTIDLPATILEYFSQPLPADMQGVPLGLTVAHDTPVREAGLYGLFGAHVNVTDGRYVYMRANQQADNRPLYEYTLLPTHMTSPFAVDELQDIGFAEPFAFSKGCRLMRIPTCHALNADQRFGNLLYDLQSDPLQQHPLQDAALEARMCELLVQEMRRNEAPTEQFVRLGLS